jgi:hypothetical protein
MPQIKDYGASSRFKADPDFRIVSRQGMTIATVMTMAQPVRGSEDSLFIVPLRFQNRWDLLAYEVLGNVEEKWIIMRHNRIADPFSGPRVGDRILIPSPAQVQYYRNQGQ